MSSLKPSYLLAISIASRPATYFGMACSKQQPAFGNRRVTVRSGAMIPKTRMA